MMKILKKLYETLRQKEFTKHVVILISGSAISQCVVFLLTPLLTRLYQPEDFGVLSVYVAIMYTFSMMTSLHYQMAIPLPKQEREAIHLLVLAIILLCLHVFIALSLLYVTRTSLMAMFPTNNIIPFIIYLPASLFGFGLFQIFELWLLRTEQYVHITKGKVRMNISQISAQTGIGLFTQSAHGLIFGEVIGRIIGGGGMALVEAKRLWQYRKKISSRLIWVMAKRYRKFPLFASWSSLLGGFTQHLPTLFIAYVLGVKAAGLYIVAERVLSLPDALIGYSIKQVYIAKSAKTLHSSFDTFYQSYKKIVRILISIALVIYLPIIILAPIIFPILFGANWTDAGMYVQYIGILFMGRFILNPISATFTLLEEQLLELVSSGLKFISLLLGMGIAAYFFTTDAHILLCITLFGTTGQCIICIFITIIMTKRKKQMQT